LGAVHENYLGANPEHPDKIMNALINADTFDTELYKGEWDFMPYFVLYAMKIPKIYTGNTLIEPVQYDQGVRGQNTGTRKCVNRRFEVYSVVHIQK